MITFKQFILEEDKKSLSDLLHGPCSNFFKQSQKNGLLFRGVQNLGDPAGTLVLTVGDEQIEIPYFKKTVRKNRKALSTNGTISKIIDDWFEDETGIKARSEAVFCYGERGRDIASTYGKPCVILPIGKFYYTWSPNVEDLYDVISDKFQDIKGNYKARILDEFGKPSEEFIRDEMESLNYTINNFDKAVQGAQEIMIDCDEYYAIPYDSDNLLSLIKMNFINS